MYRVSRLRSPFVASWEHSQAFACRLFWIFFSVLCWIIFSTWSPSHLVAGLPEQNQGGKLLYSNWCHIDALLSKNILTTVETCYKLFCLKAPIMINLARCCWCLFGSNTSKKIWWHKIGWPTGEGACGACWDCMKSAQIEKTSRASFGRA